MIKKSLKLLATIIGGSLICLIAYDILIVRVAKKSLEPEIIEAIEEYYTKTFYELDKEVQGKYFFAVDFYGMKNFIRLGKKELYLLMCAEDIMLIDDNIVGNGSIVDLMAVRMKKINGTYEVMDIQKHGEGNFSIDANRILPRRIQNKRQLSDFERKMLSNKLENDLYEQAENYYFGE